MTAKEAGLSDSQLYKQAGNSAIEVIGNIYENPELMEREE